MINETADQVGLQAQHNDPSNDAVQQDALAKSHQRLPFAYAKRNQLLVATTTPRGGGGILCRYPLDSDCRNTTLFGRACDFQGSLRMGLRPGWQ